MALICTSSLLTADRKKFVQEPEHETERPIRQILKIAGLSTSSEDFLLTKKHVYELEVLRVEN